MPRRAARSIKRTAGFRMFRTMAIVVGLLAGAFSALAWLAKPLPDASTLLAQSPLGQALPALPAKAPEPPFANLSQIRRSAARIQAAQSDAGFSMGPLAIGMTFGAFMALEVPAQDRSVKAAKKSVIGILHTEKGQFAAYFPSTETNSTAFRLSFTAAFEEYSEHEILEHLGGLWGSPDWSECARVSFANGRDCRYQWWPVNGMRVAAQIRLTDDRPRQAPVTTLRIEVIDDREERRPIAGFRLAENGRIPVIR